MKVLLVSINAKYIHTNNAVRLLKANCDFECEIVEYTIKDNPIEIIEKIEKSNADVVGFSVYIWNVSLIENIIKKLNLNGSKLVLGGPEVSYESGYFINNLPIDYVIRGEGEFAFNALLQAIQSGHDLSKIPNLTYREEGKIKHTPMLEIENLNKLNLPYYFEEDIPHIKNKIAYIESSRGCPYKCSYCLSSLEKRVRFFDINKVQDSILYLMEQGTKTVKFLDRTFNANKNTLDLLQFIIEHNNNKTVFQFEITGDILDPSIIHYLNKNAPKGLFRFEIGIQSINYETNYLVDRFQDNEKLFNNIKLIQDGGVIDLHLDLIAGLPKEDLNSFKHTFNEVFKLGAKELQLGFLKMLRGTKIRNEAEKYQYVYHQEAPYEIIQNESLSQDDISVIHLVEHMLEMYHNKGYFKDNMHHILLSKESPFDFLHQIGLHYINNNYSQSHYQVDEVYQRVFPLLSDHEQYLIKQDYLLRSKVKPKLFFDTIKDKPTKKVLFEHINQLHNTNINHLYKNAITIENEFEFFTVLYKNQSTISFTIKKADIN